jgi:hypothetical protein
MNFHVKLMSTDGAELKGNWDAESFLLKGKMFPVLKSCSFFGFPNLDIGFLSRGVLLAKRICETGRQARCRPISIRYFKLRERILLHRPLGTMRRLPLDERYLQI